MREVDVWELFEGEPSQLVVLVLCRVRRLTVLAPRCSCSDAVGHAVKSVASRSPGVDVTSVLTSLT
jgi:hypothetical protein